VGCVWRLVGSAGTPVEIEGEYSSKRGFRPLRNPGIPQPPTAAAQRYPAKCGSATGVRLQRRASGMIAPCRSRCGTTPVRRGVRRRRSGCRSSSETWSSPTPRARIGSSRLAILPSTTSPARTSSPGHCNRLLGADVERGAGSVWKPHWLRGAGRRKRSRTSPRDASTTRQVPASLPVVFAAHEVWSLFSLPRWWSRHVPGRCPTQR